MLPDIYEIQLYFGCPSTKNAMNLVYWDIRNHAGISQKCKLLHIWWVYGQQNTASFSDFASTGSTIDQTTVKNDKFIICSAAAGFV